MLWTLGAGLVSHGVAVWRRLGSLSWSKLAGPADAADVRGGAGVARVLREAGASPLLCRGAVFSSGRGCSDASLAPRRDFPLRGGVEVGPVVLRLGGGVRAGGLGGRFASCFAARRSLGLRRRYRTALFRCYRRSVLRRSTPIVSTSQFLAAASLPGLASSGRLRLAAPSRDVSWRPLLSHNWIFRHFVAKMTNVGQIMGCCVGARKRICE